MLGRVSILAALGKDRARIDDREMLHGEDSEREVGRRLYTAETGERSWGSSRAYKRSGHGRGSHGKRIAAERQILARPLAMCALINPPAVRAPASSQYSTGLPQPDGAAGCCWEQASDCVAAVSTRRSSQRAREESQIQLRRRLPTTPQG